MIYNDAYSVFAGGRHPQLLGSKVLEGWPEVADLNRRVMEVGLRGETLSFRDEHLVLYRPGRPEDVWVDLDYSPLLDDSRQAGRRARGGDRDDRAGAGRKGAARQRGAVPHVRGGDAEPRLVGDAGRQARLVQRAGLRLYRRPAEDLQGDRWGEVVHPDDLERAVATWQGACATAPSTRRSFAFAAPTASIAGIWCAPCRSATGRARWCAGSAPTPTSTTRSAPSAPCATARPIWRASSRSARSAASRCISATASATGARPSISQSTACRRGCAGKARGLGAAHPSGRSRENRAAVHRRRQGRGARLQCRISHRAPQRRAGALDRGQGRDRARCGGRARCGSSARTSTSPTASSPSRPCARASSASAWSRRVHPSCCGWAMSRASAST